MRNFSPTKISSFTVQFHLMKASGTLLKRGGKTKRQRKYYVIVIFNNNRPWRPKSDGLWEQKDFLQTFFTVELLKVELNCAQFDFQ